MILCVASTLPFSFKLVPTTATDRRSAPRDKNESAHIGSFGRGRQPLTQRAELAKQHLGESVAVGGDVRAEAIEFLLPVVRADLERLGHATGLHIDTAQIELRRRWDPANRSALGSCRALQTLHDPLEKATVIIEARPEEAPARILLQYEGERRERRI